MRVTLSEDEMVDAMMDANQGVCIKCGEFHDGIEPDTRKDKCEKCGNLSVYGLEEALLMGFVDIEEEE